VRLRATLVMATMAAACGNGEAPSAEVGLVERDSAGITIVEHVSAERGVGAGWTVAPAPELEIGMLDGPEAYQLNGVRNAVRLADGSIAVADGGSQRIRIYDAAGRHVRDLGGQGGGPGEFQGLFLVGPFRGDSLAAWDSRQKRLTIFGPDGGLGRVITFEGVPGMLAPALGWQPDGSVIVTAGMDPMAMMAMEPGERRETRTYLRADPDGTVTPIATVPGRDEVFYRAERSFGFVQVLFGRDAHAAVRDGRFVTAESGSFELAYRRSDGSAERLVRVSSPPRPVSAQEIAEARERRRASELESARQLASQVGSHAVSAAPEPTHRSTHPYFDRLELDAAGNLWVRQPGTDEDPRLWHVFDPDGRRLAVATTPAGLRVTDIGHDHLIGVARDDLDVEYVRVHRIARGGL
jgi:hypothetical protein